MKITNKLARLSDDDLLRRLSALLRDSRRVEAELIAHIAEVDERRLYAREATSSMFSYCTERLHLSEGEAYLRIQVARATRKHPVLLDMLGDGRLHLSGIGKLAPHLTVGNTDELLKRAIHRSKREIEELVAELQPRPDVPASVGKLPARPAPELRPDEVGVKSSESPLSELRPDEVERSEGDRARPIPIQPLAPERYKVQFTASAEFREKLERLEAKRFGKTKKPRKTLSQTDTKAASRNIPAAVRRTVHARDGGRCRFVDARGRRCGARKRLEFHHHDEPYGRGGDHRPGNIRLMCRTHNALLAEVEYGKGWMDQFRVVASAGPT